MAEELPVGQAQHAGPQCRHHVMGQRRLAVRITAQFGAKQHMRAVLDQRHEAQLWKGAHSATRSRATKGLVIGALVGDLQGAAIHAHQPQATVPSPLGGGHGNRLDQRVVQLLQRFPPQAPTGLRDARVAGDLERDRRVQQPLHAFEQTTQHFAVGRLHVQPQGDGIVDHHMGRQVALALTGFAGGRQHRTHARQREGLGDHTEADVVGDPAALGQCCQRACHRQFSCHGKQQHSAARYLSEEYWS